MPWGTVCARDAETTDSTFSVYNQVTNDKTYSYLYDNNGNRIKRTHLASGEITEYSWDYDNQLIQVVSKASATAQPSSTVSYQYDVFGRRIETNDNGVITRYVYDRDRVLLELDGEGELLARYVHGNGVDHPLKMEREKSPYTNASYQRQEFYYHRDRLGNVTEITDFAGNVVQRYVYDAFGGFKIYDDTGVEITTAANSKFLPNPLTFSSRAYEVTGLYYYRSRFYDPKTGSFISADPVGFAGGDTNLYRYVLNNPVNFTDPYGLLVRYASLGVDGLFFTKAYTGRFGYAYDTDTMSSSFFTATGSGEGAGLYLHGNLRGGVYNGSLENFLERPFIEKGSGGAAPFLYGTSLLARASGLGAELNRTFDAQSGQPVGVNASLNFGIGFGRSAKKINIHCPIKTMDRLVNFVRSLVPWWHRE